MRRYACLEARILMTLAFLGVGGSSVRAQPAFELEREQKQGLAEMVDLSPWLLGIGFAILLAVLISTIVLGPDVVWTKRKKKTRSLYKGEVREPDRQRYRLD